MALALAGSTWRVGQGHLMVYLPLRPILFCQKLNAQNSGAVSKPLLGMLAQKHRRGQSFQLWTKFEVVFRGTQFWTLEIDLSEKNSGKDGIMGLHCGIQVIHPYDQASKFCLWHRHEATSYTNCVVLRLVPLNHPYRQV